MKKYITHSRKFYVNAVMYFYSTPSKNIASRLLSTLSEEDIEYLDTLIYEFNNDRFIERL